MLRQVLATVLERLRRWQARCRTEAAIAHLDRRLLRDIGVGRAGGRAGDQSR